MSNFRLHQSGGDTRDLNVMNITGWATSQRSMRLTQAPGGNQAFVIGRATRLATPIRLRILVDEPTEEAARSELALITSFARTSSMLSRLTSGVESEWVRLQTNALARVSPEPMHLGATTWSTLLELRPYKPANAETGEHLVTNAGVEIATNTSTNIIVFQEA